MQGANTETESKAKELELIKYSSPTDVEYLSVVLEPNMTANISKYNNCKALKVITNKESNENVINFVTFNRNSVALACGRKAVAVHYYYSVRNFLFHKSSFIYRNLQ